MTHQHSLNIANEAGSAFRTDVNNALQAVASNSEGASAPSTTYPNQLWADTTNHLLKQRNEANSAWLTVGLLSTTNLGLLPQTGGTLTGNLAMSGAAVNYAAELSVATASTADIGNALSNNILLTGTNTVSSFGTAAAGIVRNCRASGVFTITHNATSLICTSGASITTAANDQFQMLSLGSGNWIMRNYQLANGKALITSGIFVKTVSRQVFTSGGTYTPSAGMLYCDVELVGAGANGSSGQPGGSGTYARRIMSAATIGASQTITIGTVGTSTGGNTSIGAILTANGAGSPGVSGSADFVVNGQNRGAGGGNDEGGSSPLGMGGANNTGGAGGNATGYGAGGGGGTSSGSGTPGIVIITEYCS